jgi:putative lipase involved disintegration of autophagic bodies
MASACYLLHAGFFALAYSSTLKIEVTCSSVLLVDFQQTIQYYILENRILHDDCCENFGSYMWHLCLPDLSMFNLYVCVEKLAAKNVQKQSMYFLGPPEWN